MKKYEDILQDLILAVKAEGSSLSDFYEGSVVYSILSGVSLEIETLYNRMVTDGKNLIDNGIFTAFGLQKLPPIPSGGEVTFYCSPAATGDIPIPVGTLVSADTDDGVIEFETTVAAILLNGTTEISTNVECLTKGVVGNVAANIITTIVSPITGIDGVYNTLKFTNGSGEETFEEQTIRFQQYIANLTRGTALAIKAAILDIPEILKCIVLEDTEVTALTWDSAASDYDNVSAQADNQYAGGFDIAVNNAIGDAFYIGADFPFEFINYHSLTAGTKAGTVGVFEYWNGAAWTTIVPDNDDSDEFIQNGNIEFTPPANWAMETITVGSTNFVKYWIRFRLTGTYTLAPTGDFITLPPGLGRIYVIAKDSSGGLTAPNELLVQGVVDTYIAAGITYEILAVSEEDFPITVSIQLDSGYVIGVMETLVQNELTIFFNDLDIGESVKTADIINVIMNIQGINNVIVTAPSADLPPILTKQYKITTITVTEF